MTRAPSRLVLPCALPLALLSAGCSAAATAGFLQGFAEASNPQPPAAELLIFGGANHDVFLGCLTCSQYDAASVLNGYGQHGSRYASNSIVNKYSPYGNPYSNQSACNPYTSTAPVIVDRAGNYYGELTVNQYNSKRTRIGAALRWLANVCAD